MRVEKHIAVGQRIGGEIMPQRPKDIRDHCAQRALAGEVRRGGQRRQGESRRDCPSLPRPELRTPWWPARQPKGRRREPQHQPRALGLLIQAGQGGEKPDRSGADRMRPLQPEHRRVQGQVGKQRAVPVVQGDELERQREQRHGVGGQQRRPARRHPPRQQVGEDGHRRAFQQEDDAPGEYGIAEEPEQQRQGIIGTRRIKAEKIPVQHLPMQDAMCALQQDAFVGPESLAAEERYICEGGARKDHRRPKPFRPRTLGVK